MRGRRGGGRGAGKEGDVWSEGKRGRESEREGRGGRETEGKGEGPKTCSGWHERIIKPMIFGHAYASSREICGSLKTFPVARLEMSKLS